ncbi:hypothetical protein QUA82_34170 [Microcoleus sp. F8-D3]
MATRVALGLGKSIAATIPVMTLAIHNGVDDEVSAKIGANDLERFAKKSDVSYSMIRVNEALCGDRFA